MNLIAQESIERLRQEEISAGTAIQQRKRLRAEIERQTADYLKRGGSIEQHAQGETGFRPISNHTRLEIKS